MSNEKISIIDLIRRSRFDISVIATYNAYLPFYEEVVLRQLLSNGCRHNILLMDQKQFNECMHSEELRPRSAGFDYTLIPMRATGAFHPKIVLMAGKYKGHLIVGSHNVTLSGWGTNRELSTRFDISNGKEKFGLSTATAAWRFLLDWVEFQSEMSESLIDAINAVAQMVPWLNESHSEDENGFLFYGSTPSGLSLWEQIRERIEGPIKRISVMGPFFDREMQFIHSLQNDLSPKEFIVGIEPETVDLPVKMLSGLKARIVDSSSINSKKGYLHAKAIYVESEQQNWLITGSANPGRSAWTTGPDYRNTEAIVLHEGQLSSATANAIGIDLLSSLHEIGVETIESIQTRLESKNQDQNSPIIPKTKVCIAIFKGQNIHIPKSIFRPDTFQKAECLDANNRILQTITECRHENGALVLSVHQEKVANIRTLTIIFSGGFQVVAIVHHTDIILKKTISDQQNQFRKSLASLQSDNPDIENVINFVEKVIFEEPIQIDSKILLNRKIDNNKDKNKNQESIESIEFETLGVHYSETKIAKRRRRMLQSGDLSYLLDVLIHHLGKSGIQEQEIEGVDQKGRSEEEQIGQDDDTSEGTQEEIFSIDTPQLVKICKRKVKRLIKRIEDHCQRTHEAAAGYSKCILKMIAVHALLRELCALDFKLPRVPFEESFFPVEERQKLLWLSLKYLYGEKYVFLAKAKAECVDEKLDEFSRLHGLLMWLAAICGADLRFKKPLKVFSEEEKIHLINKANLLLLVPEAASDDFAVQEAQDSFEYAAKPYKKSVYRDWLNYHQKVGNQLYRLKLKAHLLPSKKEIPRSSSGEIGFVWGEAHPNFHLVYKVGKEVVLLSDVETGEKVFSSDKVAIINIPDHHKFKMRLN